MVGLVNIVTVTASVTHHLAVSCRAAVGYHNWPSVVHYRSVAYNYRSVINYRPVINNYVAWGRCTNLYAYPHLCFSSLKS